MAIYKSKHASNYTVLPNDIFKADLSIEAIGLLAYFLSLPADWVIYKTTLHSQLKIGRDKLNNIFKELTECGYIISVEKRQSGKIIYEHIVYDKPFNGEPSNQNNVPRNNVPPLTEKPSTVEPSTVGPLTVEPSTVNRTLLSTNIPSTNKLSTNIPSKDNTYQLAVDFWLKEFHVGWSFGGVQGKKIKSILEKLQKVFPNASEQDLVGAFKYFCLNLPDWFKDKELQVLDGKFNEIMEQIKNKTNNGITKKSKFNNL